MNPRVPPLTVRRAFQRGVDLYDAGYGGRGLRDNTVAWARRLAAGGAIDRVKADLMRGWIARHGASPREARARARDGKSPASVAWLLWGADPAIPYARRGWRDPLAAWLSRAIESFER
jgi:hypothetical protein